MPSDPAQANWCPTIGMRGYPGGDPPLAAPFEGSLDVRRERSVEVRSDHDDSERTGGDSACASARERHEPRKRFAILADHDLLALGGPVDQLREMGLCIVETDRFGHRRLLG